MKEKLGRLKDWLKAHWKPVLAVVAVGAVAAYLLLSKKSATGLALPGTATAGGQAGADSGAAAATTPAVTGTAVLPVPGGTGRTGGSLFDPPKAQAPSGSNPVPAPKTFSQPARFKQPSGGFASPASQRSTILPAISNPFTRFKQPGGGFASPASQRTATSSKLPVANTPNRALQGFQAFVRSQPAPLPTAPSPLPRPGVSVNNRKL